MILTVLGARPQFIKAAAVSRALQSAGIDEIVLHTGQHFDHEMDRIFFDELDMPYPRYNLNAGGGSHAVQTAKMLEGIERVMLDLKPDKMLVYGDTNSTLAAALAAAKLSVPIAHVEAGLRSYNMNMPEEVNRKLTDHASRYLFCPSNDAADNLKQEGIIEGVHVVGDVMLDAFQLFRSSYKAKPLPEGLTEGDFMLFTLHRPSNTDDQSRLSSIITALGSLDLPVVWPVHPRVKQALDVLGIPGNVRLLPAQSYLSMMRLLAAAYGLITDSGGMQKEAYWAKTKCITLRDETEWVETLKNGWNQLVTSPERLKHVIDTVPGEWLPLYGDGNASIRIADVLK
jgi:UDP-N-acetylglucosamine 2-epimerase